MVKKTKLESIEMLDKICTQSTHLVNVYKNLRDKQSDKSAERFFFDMIRKYYSDIARGACGLFDTAVNISHTEYIPRQLIIKEYKEFVKKESSTAK